MQISTFRLVAGGMVLFAVCLLLPGSPALSDSRRPDVQVQTEYTVGPAQTDASRAIDMAERVSLQNQQSTQVQLDRIEAKLDKLADRLDSLDRRLAAIEQHLGIVPAPPGAPTPVAQPMPARPAKPVK